MQGEDGGSPPRNQMFAIMNKNGSFNSLQSVSMPTPKYGRANDTPGFFDALPNQPQSNSINDTKRIYNRSLNQSDTQSGRMTPLVSHRYDHTGDNSQGAPRIVTGISSIHNRATPTYELTHSINFQDYTQDFQKAPSSPHQSEQSAASIFLLYGNFIFELLPSDFTLLLRIQKDLVVKAKQKGTKLQAHPASKALNPNLRPNSANRLFTKQLNATCQEEVMMKVVTAFFSMVTQMGRAYPTKPQRSSSTSRAPNFHHLPFTQQYSKLIENFKKLAQVSRVEKSKVLYSNAQSPRGVEPLGMSSSLAKFFPVFQDYQPLQPRNINSAIISTPTSSKGRMKSTVYEPVQKPNTPNKIRDASTDSPQQCSKGFSSSLNQKLSRDFAQAQAETLGKTFFQKTLRKDIVLPSSIEGQINLQSSEIGGKPLWIVSTTKNQNSRPYYNWKH